MKKLLSLCAILAVAITVLAVDANRSNNSTQQEQYRLAYTATCNLKSAFGYNKGSSTVYLMLIDTNAAPASGAVPTLPPIPVSPGTGGYYAYPAGRPMTRGIMVGFSTNDVTYSGTYTNGWFDVTWTSQ